MYLSGAPDINPVLICLTFASQSSPMSAMASSSMTTANPITRISFSALPVKSSSLVCEIIYYDDEEGKEEEGGEGRSASYVVLIPGGGQ